MNAKSFVLALLSASKENRITGKKRLQKLSMLLKSSGVEVDADFSLLHYGPFSYDIADAADELTLTGLVEETSVPVGVFGTFQSEYRLPEDSDVGERLPEQAIEKLKELAEFSTIELEVASTILYFKHVGKTTDEAISETIAIKPKKAVPDILKNALQAVDIV